MQTPTMRKMQQEQIKRLPKMALWHDSDMAIAVAIGIVIGFLIGLAI
ncbi:hypothetical protein N8Z09_02755 [Methylophilaceae bacterium]|nr:hypothetical protein [Methylophilaceae bacterium]